MFRAIAVPITFDHVLVTDLYQMLKRHYFSDISRNDGRLCKSVENIVKPWGKVSLAIFSEVHSRHGAQFDAQRLKEDGKDVGHENDEE
jgi:hypothetical protein